MLDEKHQRAEAEIASLWQCQPSSCIKAFSGTDFTEDLKKIDVPALILHGDADQVVPIGASCVWQLILAHPPS